MKRLALFAKTSNLLLFDICAAEDAGSEGYISAKKLATCLQLNNSFDRVDILRFIEYSNYTLPSAVQRWSHMNY